MLQTKLTDRSGLGASVGWERLVTLGLYRNFTFCINILITRVLLRLSFREDTVWTSAISLCDGLGEPAAAGSIGFYFARNAGMLFVFVH